MTILIALAIDDYVLMMADGRRRNKIALVTDEAQKLTLLRDDLVLGVAGAEIGTNLAEEILRQGGAASGQALVDQLGELAFACADHVGSLITSETRQMAHVKVGLLAGGLDSEGAYLAAALYGDGMDSPDRTLARATQTEPKFIVLGGESVGATDAFRVHLIAALRTQSSTSPALLPALLAAGEATIRFAAARDESIGGTIRYCVLNREDSPVSGTL